MVVFMDVLGLEANAGSRARRLRSFFKGGRLSPSLPMCKPFLRHDKETAAGDNGGRLFTFVG